MTVARIALVKPEKARSVEDVVLRAAQMGQIVEKVMSNVANSFVKYVCTFLLLASCFMLLASCFLHLDSMSEAILKNASFSGFWRKAHNIVGTDQQPNN